VQQRKQQVERGMPIAALPINVPHTEVGVRAVALQAERFDLNPGETWMPISDSNPSGPHFAVIVAGRAMLEVVSDRRPVMRLSPGSLLVEGAAAEFNSRLRALSAVEGYRVRYYDLSIVTSSIKSAEEWDKRFRLFFEETKHLLASRLMSVRGAAESCAQHADDFAIQAFINSQKECRHFAEFARAQRLRYSLKIPLPEPPQLRKFVKLPALRRQASLPILPPSMATSRASTADGEQLQEDSSQLAAGPSASSSSMVTFSQS